MAKTDKKHDDRKHERASLIAETPPTPIIVPKRALQLRSRRDFIIYSASAIAAASGFYALLPDEAKQRLGVSSPRPLPAKDRLLTKMMAFDDDVAEALYSPNRRVPTYDKSQITPNLRNNYDGATPDPDYIPNWTLTVAGLASGKMAILHSKDLLTRFPHHEQITRLVCVEGWSAIAWWGGLRFSDLLKAYPPMQGARWARLDSDVNLDSDGNSDPYYVSIDLSTAQHPQSILATHNNGKPLSVEHGAPLRLVVPMKLGLKNIKAITKIEYMKTEPPDYWNERGYSKYDGL